MVQGRSRTAGCSQYHPLKEIIRAELPAGYRAMSLEDGAALGGEALSSQAALNSALEEKLIHLGQKMTGWPESFGPGTMRSRLRRQPMPQDDSQNQNKGLLARLGLLRALESGLVNSIECPDCHEHSITVWFTHPSENEYRTWFVCCARVQDAGAEFTTGELL